MEIHSYLHIFVKNYHFKLETSQQCKKYHKANQLDNKLLNNIAYLKWSCEEKQKRKTL